MASYLHCGPGAASFYVPAIERFCRIADRLAGAEAHGAEHGELESLVLAEGTEALRLLLQGHLDEPQATEPRQEAVVGADSFARPHRRENCGRALETVLGEVEVRRRGYEGKDLSRVYPLDAALNLPPDRYSHGLRERLMGEITQGSFDTSVEKLVEQGGGPVPKRQAEGLAAAVSRDFDAFYEQAQEEVSPAKPEDLLVLTCDGKGVVMIPEGLREATRKAAEGASRRGKTRLAAGDKKHRKRMAMVVSVYDIAPHRRTAESILGDQPAVVVRPTPQHKRTWARIEPAAGTVIEQMFAEAMRRDPQQQRRWVVLVDGQPEQLRQIQATAAKCQLKITIVQDFVHVLEYLWKAGNALYPDDAQEREDWVKDRAYALLEGRARDVAVGLRRAATRKALSQKAREPLDQAADYIDNSRERLRYGEALALGLPIATGVIEGACRYLVKDRMDITGARWGLQTAEAVLKLRSLKVSGDLKDYLAFHHRQEYLRNYPTPPMPPTKLPTAA